MLDKKLKKLKMPESSKPEKEMMDELMAEYEDSPEDEVGPGMEEDEDMVLGEEMGIEPAAPAELAAVSDEELMAELKKRGLMGDLEEEELA
jgi:hypothetical protein